MEENADRNAAEEHEPAAPAARRSADWIVERLRSVFNKLAVITYSSHQLMLSEFTATEAI